MSEHKFKVGDKVIDKNFPDTILTVCTVDGDIVEVEPEKYNLPKWTYNAKNLEHVSDHMDADEIAELFKETEEKDKKEHTLPNPADLMSIMDEDTQRLIEKVEEKANNPIHHWYDNREYTAYLKGWKVGRHEGYEEGYAVGLNVTRKAIDDILEQLCTKQS